MKCKNINKDLYGIPYPSIGQRFETNRPLMELTIHTCTGIKKPNEKGSDAYWTGWIVDQDSTMINPKHITRILNP